jgi:hypothetical protein
MSSSISVRGCGGPRRASNPFPRLRGRRFSATSECGWARIIGCNAARRARARQSLDGAPPLTTGASAAWNLSTLRRLLLSKEALGFYCPIDGSPPAPGFYPSVVTEAEYYAAQGRLQIAKQVKRTLKRGEGNLFTGLGCGGCGWSLVRILAFSPDLGRQRYRLSVIFSSLLQSRQTLKPDKNVKLVEIANGQADATCLGW